MRASRLLSILILLQLRGRVTAEWLAREFEVSQRTIYRDMDALSAAGVPLYGDKGPGGGFQLLDGYRTRLTGLDRDEAAAMLLAGVPGPAGALGIGEAAARARNKLLAALPAPMQGEAGRLGGRIHLDMADWYRAAAPPPHLPELAQALAEGRFVSFAYESWAQKRTWKVGPLGLVLKGGQWYLAGESGARQLTFKVADMSTFQTLEEDFAPPDDFDLALWWTRSLARFEAELRPVTARLSASPNGLKRIAALGDFAARAVARASAPDASGWCEISLPVETGDHSVLALLGCGPEFEVIEPAALRRKIGRLAREIAQRMEGMEGEAG